jgi:hypothetical protein
MGQITAFDLNEFITNYNTTIYFETGTGIGESLGYANNYNFKKLYTVDIDEELSDKIKKKYKGNDKIVVTCDYSTNAITNDLPKIPKEENILFFLDAHFPGADFHKISYEESIRQYKKDAFPLEQELKLIISNRNVSNDVFVIDDFMLYESGDYDSIKEGVIWKYNWLQEELNIKTESYFIYELFKDTHDFKKDTRHQGYLVITPKKII